MNRNICKFINKNNNANDIHIVNFVFETKKQIFKQLYDSSYYKINYVTKGSGFLHLQDSKYNLKDGDIFFTFPGTGHAIESDTDFEYIYISFLGTRPIEIMERLGINQNNFIFHNFKDDLNLWKSFIESTSATADIKAECVLLYTFSLLEDYLPINESKSKITDTIHLIKSFVDENISNPDLSLEMVSNHFSYNKKYISALFKNKLNIGFSDYVNTVRVQEACTLIAQGITSVQDLAYLTGFKDAMYFSRIFKKKMHLSPKKHMESIKNS